jgi:hypothetical protein
MTSAGDIIWVGIVAGIIGTIGMTAFLSIVTKTDVVHADMVRAIGSLLTKSLDNALRVGLIIHITWGIIFGILYTVIISYFDVQNFLLTVSIGMVIGFIHGFAVSLLLVVAVAEHHPIEQFKNPGFGVAAAHFIAHLIYGTLVGFVAALMK